MQKFKSKLNLNKRKTVFEAAIHNVCAVIFGFYRKYIDKICFSFLSSIEGPCTCTGLSWDARPGKDDCTTPLCSRTDP